MAAHCVGSWRGSQRDRRTATNTWETQRGRRVEEEREARDERAKGERARQQQGGLAFRHEGRHEQERGDATGAGH